MQHSVGWIFKAQMHNSNTVLLIRMQSMQKEISFNRLSFQRNSFAIVSLLVVL